MKKIVENRTAPFILGAIDGWGDIHHIVSRDDDTRHPRSWERYKTWRFIPETGLLMWWESPDEGEKRTVEDWLERNGYDVNLRSVLGNSMRFNKENIESGNLEKEYNKQYKFAGEYVDGMKVLSNIDNISSIGASLNNYEILNGIREVPMSDFSATGKHYSVQGTNRIKELANQIQHSQEISPLIVVIDNEGPYILEGAHRLEALYLLKKKAFPALVVIDTEEQNELNEIEYPMANDDELHSFGGMRGWKGKIVWMPPEKFLKLVNPLPDYQMSEKSYWNIKRRIENKLPLDFLVLKIDPEKKKVIGHEGRHRATVAKEMGIKEVPVLIWVADPYPRVPKWTDKEHEFADKAEFKPEWEVDEALINEVHLEDLSDPPSTLADG